MKFTAISARTVLAVWAGKVILILSRRLGWGGSTLPGRIALRLAPGLIAELGRALPLGSLVISGTNGKTTTAKMLAAVAEAAGRRVAHNRAGANLVWGVASALIADARAGGRPRGELGIFEVDEATMPQVAPLLAPRTAVVTNFFRDQLDRFGELTHTVALVGGGIDHLQAGGVAVLNADDPLVASLGANRPGAALYYGIEDPGAGLAAAAAAAGASDAAHCVHCGTPYVYHRVYYAHVGIYRCPACGNARPRPAVYAEQIHAADAGGSSFHLVTPAGSAAVRLQVPGLYNVYNALAAAAGALAIGFELPAIAAGLSATGSGFGRMERLDIHGRQLTIALVKNPVGFGEVIRTLLGPARARYVLICINDRYADGTDVSWLWDVDFEQLAPHQQRFELLLCSGVRAADMAVRLKYAGVDPARLQVEADLGRALQQALEQVPAGEHLYVLPTYTAMLELREILHRQGRVQAFWEV